MKHTYRTTLYLSVFFLILFHVSGYAQKLTTKSKKAATFYKEGEHFFSMDQFERAKMPLNQAIEKDPDFLEAYLLLSEVYYAQEDYQNQANLLETVISKDSTFYVFSYYSLGIANFHLDQFDEALKWFNKYYTKTSNVKSKEKVDNWIKKTLFVKVAKENPRNIEAVNLGDNINTVNNEYWPSITADDQTLVYTVLVPREQALVNKPFVPSMANYYHEDFYKAVKDNSGEWTKGKALTAPINTDSNEGAQTLSADGNWMFFTACGRSDTRGSCDIYFSYRTEYGWSTPKNIDPPVNSLYWESQPSFSSDGRTLYFSSNRGGGKGGNDIWKAVLIGYQSDGTPFFGKPENLGDHVNTPFNEVSPFIHPDNHTLYFSSNGWPGMGEMDIFLSRKDENNQFEKPENLGYPINSTGDDVGLIVTADGQKAYFSSERFGSSFGGKDLYSFNMPPEIRPQPVSYVRGRVFDNDTKEKLEASFELKDIHTKQMVVRASSTGFSGEFLICLPAGKSYALNVSKEGYLFYSDHFDMEKETSSVDPMVMDVYLKKIKVGQQIVLKNIFYETDSYVLKDASEVELEKIVSFLNINSTVKAKIIGYTDNVGSKDYNINLSNKRAEQVYNYLIEAGIDKTRLSHQGKGMADPVATNDTEEGRAKNRRTEMKIVE
ncbi:OmpA family protein [Plebeiibacterium sediminum]|uniref:OmpA family protein n=1 Tax=Plebeiibacterium sediminum TaxID=2992112 RepID=A0AAE3SFN6_9BACT|nr:OmpA family protein [Plebeiobacterium sediminum]MCW3787633.1 OmpA family protein [Plebeiobacterium sediminum]